jgi:DNA-binding beta-propeller fold protein YncE
MKTSHKHIIVAHLLGCCAALFAGCGAGGGSVGTSSISTLQHSPLTAQSLAVPATTKGNVSFAIAFTPKAKAIARKITPQYVSPSTESLQILTDAGSQVVINLSGSSPNCSPNLKVPGSFICTARLSVPAGTHVFFVTAYDGQDGLGNVLSQNSSGPVYVKPTTPTTVSIVLEGVVRNVILTLATTSPPVGKAAAIPLTAVLEDADHNLIVGAAPYAQPVTLTTSDANDGPLSKTSLNSPADVSGITVNYTGANVRCISYTATADGFQAGNVSSAVLTPGSALAAHLFVTNTGNNTISVFDTMHCNAVLPIITGGLADPLGAVVDASGKLYVANDDRTINIFDTARGNAVLPPITGGGLNTPYGMALDASGKLYVANVLANNVLVFDTAHGNAVLPAITGGGIDQPYAVALGATGKLYVANAFGGDRGSISVFDTNNGNAALEPIINSGLSEPIGVAVDSSGKLYVSNYQNDTVSVFDTTNGNVPLPAIPVFGGGAIMGVAVDASGKLYVVDGAANGVNAPGPSVRVFDTTNGNAALPPITNGGLSGPFGIAVH